MIPAWPCIVRACVRVYICVCVCVRALFKDVIIIGYHFTHRQLQETEYTAVPVLCLVAADATLHLYEYSLH